MFFKKKDKKRYNVLHPIKNKYQIAIRETRIFRGAYFRFADGVTINESQAIINPIKDN